MNNQNLPTVLFDLDGVAANWRDAMMVFFPEFTIDTLNNHPNRKELIGKVYAKYPEFFADLPLIESFLTLFGCVLEAGYPIGWLSAIGEEHQNPVDVRAHKLQWIRDNVDAYFGTTTVDNAIIVDASSDKILHAKPNVILVDDFARNRKEFKDAGGHAVRFDVDTQPHTAFNELEATTKLIRRNTMHNSIKSVTRSGTTLNVTLTDSQGGTFPVVVNNALGDFIAVHDNRHIVITDSENATVIDCIGHTPAVDETLTATVQDIHARVRSHGVHPSQVAAMVVGNVRQFLSSGAIKEVPVAFPGLEALTRSCKAALSQGGVRRGECVAMTATTSASKSALHNFTATLNEDNNQLIISCDGHQLAAIGAEIGQTIIAATNDDCSEIRTYSNGVYRAWLRNGKELTHSVEGTQELCKCHQRDSANYLPASILLRTRPAYMHSSEFKAVPPGQPPVTHTVLLSAKRDCVTATNSNGDTESVRALADNRKMTVFASKDGNVIRTYRNELYTVYAFDGESYKEDKAAGLRLASNKIATGNSVKCVLAYADTINNRYFTEVKPEVLTVTDVTATRNGVEVKLSDNVLHRIMEGTDFLSPDNIAVVRGSKIRVLAGKSISVWVVADGKLVKDENLTIKLGLRINQHGKNLRPSLTEIVTTMTNLDGPYSRAVIAGVKYKRTDVRGCAFCVKAKEQMAAMVHMES